MPEERGATAHKAKSCACEACKKKRHEPHKISLGLVHGYSDRPAGGWTPRITLAEQAKGVPHDLLLGVELETSLAEYGTPAYNGSLQSDEAASLARPLSLWLPKHDSSVSGPEFASQPGSLAYWQAISPALTDMFTALLHGGVRSHEGDTCGMHVNISTATFREADHLVRFAKLIHTNVRWTRKMSQRTESSTNSWAKLSGTMLCDEDFVWAWADRIIDRGVAGHDRYMALNAQNPGRVEFRLPRGTLRLDRFYKNLEWTAAMVEYTREQFDETGKPKAIVPASFMRWVVARKAEYPYLNDFLAEKFAASSGELVAA